MKAENFCMGCMSRKAQGSVCPKCGWKHGTDPESPLYLAPGSILNKKYIIGRVLGAGGFGITYLARDSVLDIKLCIKEFLPRDLAARSLNLAEISIYTGEAQKNFQYGLEKFLEEGRALAKFVNHPGIVSVRDYFKENNTAYLVMLYLEGRTLKEYLEEHGGKIDYDTALKIMMPVMDALRELHKIDMLHRDISPDNIYITREGQVKLLDFGAARYAMGEHSRSLSVVLKPGYAPEEQYRSKGKQGPWTDIYAVGATFYKAITGTLPPEALDRLDEDTLELPSQSGVIISGQAEQALFKALSVRAKGRFQRMDELQKALMEVDIGQDKVQENRLQGDMGQEKAQETSIPDNSSSGPVSTTSSGTAPAGEDILKAEKPYSEVSKATGREDNTGPGSELSNKNTGRMIMGAIAVVIVFVCAFVLFNDGKRDQGVSRQDTRAENSSYSGKSSDKEVTIEGPEVGQPWTEPITGMEFVWVEGGCYEMGCGSWTSDCDDDEKPVHEVCLDGFWMGRYEVTQGQWIEIMGDNPSKFKSGDEFPVETVSWDDAKEFISKINQRSGNKLSLPTEAQWEYAARSGGKREKYAGGNTPGSVAWYDDNSGKKTHRVGTKSPNGLGISDMSGNVWEWCEDKYDKNAYSKHGRKNPVVTSGKASRVRRGGSWGNNARDVRAAFRNWYSADLRYFNLGFRLCVSRVR